MIYRQFQELQLSALGFGAMRLPLIDGQDAEIDKDATARMVAYAMTHGVNYYDTAWGYHGGNSETVMGEILQGYPREQFCLATKFPGYELSNMDKVEEIFEKQLEKCRVDYFDFYLFHNVCELNIDGYLDPKFGIFGYLMEQKKNGRIRHLGFSAHGSLETMTRFLDAYGEAMEFCQIQLNWLDWEFQNAKGKMELLKSRNIPVWVMEPVRGGSLAKLPAVHESALRSLRPERTPVEWAFRFLQSLPDAVVTLSGMSNPEQLKENIALYEAEEPLSKEEMDALIRIARAMTGRETVPCTACRYCISHCPVGLDIPRLLTLYNEHAYSKGSFITTMGMGALEPEKQPAACVGCRSCEEVCPQGIKISEVMADFAKRLRK